MLNNIRLASLQGSWKGSAESTQRWYLEQAANITPNSVDLLLLPELVHTPYFPFEENPDHFDLALEDNHVFVTQWAKMAQQLHAVIVFPYFEKRDRGIYHNSALIFERDGSIAGKYRKSHIPDDPSFYEKFYFIPGDTGFTPIATSAGRIGVLICWDQWFPEAARIMCLRGADVLVYPTAIGWDSGEPQSIYARQHSSWETVMRGHAIANRVFVAAVNRTGKEGHLQFWGQSFICAPDGHILNKCGSDKDELSQYEINLNEMEHQRRWWPHFRDRRTDLYSPLVKIWDTP